LGVGCGESTRHVPASNGGGEAGEGHDSSLSGTGGVGAAEDTAGSGGADDENSKAGSSRGGTAGTGSGSGGRGARAGEAGEPALGGKAGRDTGPDCTPSDGGEAGEEGEVWIGNPVMGDGPPLCVPDCMSADYEPAELVGCEWVCPESSPVRAESCEIRCNDEVTCGPGLLCSRWTHAFYSYADPCIEPSDDVDSCGCFRVPETCEASETDRPVCGEDGKSYSSLCEAHRARTDLVGAIYDDEDICTLDDARYFNCEGIFCLRGSEYCVLQGALDDHDLDRFFCEPSPCGETGSCDCVIADIVEKHGEPEENLTCSELGAGAVVVDDYPGNW
jgi:hypothetical protein